MKKGKITKIGTALFVVLLFVGFAFAFSRGFFDPLSEWREEGEQLSGGETTVFNTSVNAFGEAAPNLTGNKDLFFVTGNAFFKRNWVTAPASTEDLDGLGPLFNARSCSSCHNLDGKGAPPESPDEHPVDLLFRLSRPAPDSIRTIPDENYGRQFNHLSVLGVEPEGEVQVTYNEISGEYPDGMSYTLREPVYEFKNLKYGAFPDDIMISPRIAQHLVGLGLLEAIDEETLKSLADPDDSDGDGISGKLNYVYDYASEELKVGRFGWKANQPSVRQQTAVAFREDIGITSELFPDELCAEFQTECKEARSGGDPELTEDILDRVALYMETIAVPARRNWDEPDVLKGKRAFHTIGCASCHVPKLQTGEHPEHPEFSNQIIYPYTDLLLHDMGEGLADNALDAEATGTEWRTPPLWGIGLVETVSGHTYFLHDGRARNLEEAILWHGGEAEQSQQNFKQLSKEERDNLIKFLNSL
ncbi:di-heme oxidoreductase family protein [Rhodohalobacter sp. 614A]|uniref:di-heme oxidoreductase family protein n=1 Tax=Rhodohalobacter sp. 614A TaxID=2908649 RepID=UPI001F388E9B|nr:di-heme oxidoredictase family protein [Rhodohalobacter sp. 614A]